MPTKQETFDTVARHLLTQNKCSANDDGLCVYRGPDGLMCAAGCLISDEDYSPGMEDTAVRSSNGYRNAVTRLMLRLGHDIVLVEGLQRVHDRTAVASWPDNLRDVARRFELSAAVVDELAA